MTFRSNTNFGPVTRQRVSTVMGVQGPAGPQGPPGPSGVVTFAGDLAGNSTSQEVVGLLNHVLPALGSGYLNWTGSAWALTALPTSLPPSGAAGGRLAGTYPNPTLAASGVTAATYGDATHVPQITVSTDGTISLVTSVLITGVTPGGAAGGDLSGSYPNPTVAKINGASVPASGALTTGNGLYVTGASTLGYSALNLAGGSGWVTGVLPAANQASQTMGGDVTGTTAASTVAKIQGNTVASGALTKGQFLVATSTSNWAATTLSTDLSESAVTPGSVTVVGLKGAVLPSLPGTDQYLHYTGSAWAFAALPTSLPPNGSAGGDLSGSYPNPTVAKINGASVPASGALTTGNGLYVTGTSTLGYSALNLAGGANFVTGLLPAANQASQTMGGDVTGTTAASTVAKIQGVSVPAPSGTGTVLTYSGTSLSWATPGGGTSAPVTFTRRTNTSNAKYTIDSTGGGSDYYILHADSAVVDYVMPTPTDGRTLVIKDKTGQLETNAIYFVPSGNEKFDNQTPTTLSGSAYHFTNGSATVTATSSKFTTELAVGMSIQSSNQSGVNYIVSAIGSDTSLTISANFTGTTTTTATATRTSLQFSTNYGALTLFSDGTDWYTA